MNNIFKSSLSSSPKHHQDNEAAIDPSDSGSDTFDIFSSRESLHNDDHHNIHDHHSTITTVTKPTMISSNQTTSQSTQQRPVLKKMNLSIDLSGIHSDDDDYETKNHQNYQIPDQEDDHFILTTSKRTSASSSMRQIKPDNIPNLALDVFDDDKSQSVTVSLAKSMCKEINYKKEMEAIVSKENFNVNHQELSNQYNQAPPKSNRLKPIQHVTDANKKKARQINQPPPGGSSSSSTTLSLNLTSGVKQVLLSKRK